jgi:glycosyltransferase involved in cell wall biosynthesis
MSLAPRVSVIVPAYNCARYVHEALHSALEQDYPNKEIIVVDDGSIDDTPQVLRSFGDQIVVTQQTNAGAASARNTGLQVARGDYIAFLDADDIWLPGKLKAQVEYLQIHPEIGMVYSAWMEWLANDQGEFVPPEVPVANSSDLSIDPDASGWLYNKLLLDCIIHTTTVVFRRDVVQQVGLFDLNLRRGQDYDYWFRVSRLTSIHKLRAVLSLYRMHRDSITRKAHATNYGYVVLQNALNRWGRVGPDGTVTPKKVMNSALARTWLDYGYMHYTTGDPALALHAFKQCISYRPLWHSGWVYWMRSWLKVLQTSH